MYKDVKSMIRHMGRKRTALLGSHGDQGVVRIFKIVNKEDVVQWDCSFVSMDAWGDDTIREPFAYVKDDEIFASATYVDGEWLYDKPRTLARLQKTIPDPMTELEKLIESGGDLLDSLPFDFSFGQPVLCRGLAFEDINHTYSH